jgi:ABC-type nickel/cobalt efflux system permease component RcnA
MKQSRFMSLVESITNVAVGYVLALVTQVVVFPLFGITASLSEHLMIGAAFTAVSILRSYILRRAFEAWRVHRERRA